MACSVCDIFESCHRELSKNPSSLKPYCTEKCLDYHLWKLLKRHNINATLRIRENKQREKALDLKKR